MKTKFKFLIIIAIMLGTLLIFTNNKSEAYSRAVITDGEPTTNLLDNIPDIVNLDIKESEVEKVPDLIMEKITQELKQQGINTISESEYEKSADDKYLVSVWFGSLEDEFTSWDYIGDIYKVNVRISKGYVNTNYVINKEITIKYNNSDNYKEEDKNYVTNLIKNFKKEHSVIYNYVKPNENYDFMKKLHQIINDPSITLVYNGAVACDMEWSESGLLVFKDDVYYDRTSVESYTYYVTSNVDIGNNIVVDGLLENVTITVISKENSEMRNEVINLGYKDVLGEYELTLVGADTLVCPIDITFYVGKRYNGNIACILHKKKDGTEEKFEERISDGKATITVNELSPFIVAVKENDYLLGDVDGNGKIEAQDAVMILKYVAHNIDLTDYQLLAANTTKDADGKVDSQDAVQILKYVAHNITEF